ncbi:hypothetical protein BH10CHL1_BH10CHL1_11560 [soil metagenome]
MLDLREVDRCLHLAMELKGLTLEDIVNEISLVIQPPSLVRAIAEKSVAAIITLMAVNHPQVDIERLRRLWIGSELLCQRD